MTLTDEDRAEAIRIASIHHMPVRGTNEAYLAGLAAGAKRERDATPLICPQCGTTMRRDDDLLSRCQLESDRRAETAFYEGKRLGAEGVRALGDDGAQE